MYSFLSSKEFSCANDDTDAVNHQITGEINVFSWPSLILNTGPASEWTRLLVESRALICRLIGSQVYLAACVCVCSQSKEQKCVWLWPALAWPLWPAGLTASLYEEKPPTLQWCSAEPTETPRSTYLMRLDGLFEKSHTEALQEETVMLFVESNVYLYSVCKD